MRVPKHIGIIPDGNRRWAQQHQMDKQEGYTHGLQPGVQLLQCARKYGVEELTYYGFTVDNCKRPHAQFLAFSKACVDAVSLISKEGVSLLVVGNTESKSFPKALLPYTKERKDIAGGGIKVNFLVNYGWDWDLSALKNSDKSGIAGLHSHDISRMELIIRWGGMRRLSGFLPVQSVYSDFYVVDDLWPDFKPEHLDQALEWYNHQDVTLGG